MLGRLVNRGAVIPEGSGRKRLAAAERLYSIYYKLRRERDEAAVVRNLIHFMAVFYSKAELAEMSGMLVEESARHQADMDAFRSAYAAFVPGDETMMLEMIQIAPDLIVSGASEHDLVEVLSSDKEKSDSLTPLVVALRQNIGEEVRASPEVLEVATDIRKLIEERSGLRKPLER